MSNKKYYLVRKANATAFSKMSRYQSKKISTKLKDVCDEISVGIYIGDMTPDGFFLINFNNDKYYTPRCIESFNEFIAKTLISGNWYITAEDGTTGDGEMMYEFISSRMVYNIENRVFEKKYNYVF